MSRFIKLSSALHMIAFLTLLLGIVFTAPLEPARAQIEGPVPPAPPRLEAYPVVRDVDASSKLRA